MIRRLPRKLKKQLKVKEVNIQEFIDKKNRDKSINNSLDLIFKDKCSSITEVVQDSIKE